MTKHTTAELYRWFLASDWWINLSRLKRRLVGKCEKCSLRGTLQCHHLRYPEHWFDVTLEDLQVLCRRCHRNLHGLSTPTVTTYTRKERHEWKSDYRRRMKARKKAKKIVFV